METLDILALEQKGEELKKPAGRVVLDHGSFNWGKALSKPLCYGQPMKTYGSRQEAVNSHSGEVTKI